MENIRKTIQVRLSDGEAKMVDELCQRFDCGVSALVKEWIRWNHKKTFPAYAAGTSKLVKPLDPDDELTNEQLCEKLGGKVVKGEFGYSCRFPTIGENGVLVPITARKEFRKYYKP